MSICLLVRSRYHCLSRDGSAAVSRPARQLSKSNSWLDDDHTNIKPANFQFRSQSISYYTITFRFNSFLLISYSHYCFHHHTRIIQNNYSLWRSNFGFESIFEITCICRSQWTYGRRGYDAKTSFLDLGESGENELLLFVGQTGIHTNNSKKYDTHIVAPMDYRTFSKTWEWFNEIHIDDAIFSLK